MEQFIKNLDYSTVLNLAEQVVFLPGQVISKTLVQNKSVGMTLFAIPKGEGISAHKSTGDAFVQVLTGTCEIEIDDKHYEMGKGECIIMPAGHPHAVSAKDDFKMLLVVIFPPQL